MTGAKNLIFPSAQFMDFSLNMDPIKITVEMRNPTTAELLQYITWTLDVNKQWLALPVYFPESSIKTQRLLSLGMIFHVISILLAFVSILIHLVRRCGKCMSIEVKYSMIIKKFESGSSHLELNQKTGDDLKTKGFRSPFDEDAFEQQGLLKADNSAIEMVPMNKVSEKDTEESQPSEVSHYIEDDDGHVTRIMIKNLKKGIKDEFFESRTKDFKLTPKSKLMQDHMQLLDDMMNSEDTLDGKKMAHKIDKYGMLKQEMCEDPPEFISENGDFNPDILNRSIVDGSVDMKLNLSDLKNAQDEFMSQNTPTPYGQFKHKGLSNRDNKSKYGPGNLTSRSHGKGSEIGT